MGEHTRDKLLAERCAKIAALIRVQYLEGRVRDLEDRVQDLEAFRRQQMAETGATSAHVSKSTSARLRFDSVVQDINTRAERANRQRRLKALGISRLEGQRYLMTAAKCSIIDL